MTPSLSPTQLARQAFDRAVDDLFDARDAGKISPADASVKFRQMYDAYLEEKENLRLGAFLKRNGLDKIVAENASNIKASANLNTVTEKVCAAICASISPDRAA